ncbi:Holliday junction branch migration protein RuvA [Ferruginivarius sediminum]|uniref:Holliday junction branch migration complex subunit RuvA n=1 Tax=Ferruginivarius sediminum TaxID=2661937 RepID=A0A369T971_9PROT|nr:Holliday junction branch migration protein RuvA [Ferruginivarius sediminum]RDD61840.1 Holliday junction branch migration protein RuvA [Ferruginivarius sediminum]
MIGKLRGLVDSTDADGLVLDVHGVGYVVFASARTLNRLPVIGGEASLLIETHVREDHIHLYGFGERAERDWFRLLCSVQGVGARHALAILSVLSPQELAQAVAAQDKQAISRANGVGPKLAGRIASELKDKAGQIGGASMEQPVGTGATVGAGAAEPDGAGQVSEDAVSALTNLGYRRTEAFGAVATAARRLGREAPLQALITEGLKELSQ